MTVNEISSEWRIFLVREKEVPGGTDAHVVVAVAVPVVDVEAVLVEVADARNVASVGRRERIMPVPINVTGDLGLPPNRAYVLFPLNFIREHPLITAEPPLKTGKKFNLYFLLHATVIPACRQAGVNDGILAIPPACAEASAGRQKKRRPRGEAGGDSRSG